MRTIVERLKDREERGQILVILAIAMIGLLAFAGLAVDTGVVLTRHAQLRRATDAAALGGVVELVDGTQTTADERAQQIFAANNIAITTLNVWHVVPAASPCLGTRVCTFDTPRQECPDCRTVCGGDLTCMFTTLNPSGVPQKQVGANQYQLSSSWAVPLYFLQLIGIDTVRIGAEATAEHLPEALLYASSGVETGLVSTSNQSIFGPDLCTSYGDPYTPTRRSVGVANPWYGDLNGVYHFKIKVPANYPYDVVRVEIYDPDSYNKPNATVKICQETRAGGGSSIWLLGQTPTCYDSPADDPDTYPPTDEDDVVGVNTGSVCDGQTEPCVPEMDSISGAAGRSPNIEFYFYRIDENRGTGTVGQCSPNPGSYTARYETITEYTLYYYERQEDGSLVRHNLARYTSKRSDTGGGEAQCTDMHWVSPGAPVPMNYPATGCESIAAATETGFADTGDGDFEISLSSDAPNMAADVLTGDRFIYLDVRGVPRSESGGNGVSASENGFEFWAGPDLSVYPDVPSEVNDRNRWVVMKGVEEAHGSAGVIVFGVGHLPMNSNTANRVDIPLMWVGPQMAGSTITVRMFDPDAGSTGYPDFFFDTIPYSDWHTGDTFGNNACNNQTVGDPWGDRWYPEDLPGPPCTFVVPSLSDTPSIPFYGGSLMVRYKAGGSDTYSWHITVETRPYLVD
jgi:hypothetical protein